MDMNYVHDLNPVIFHITDAIAVRWYGLAYLLGFVVGYYLLYCLSKRDLYPVAQDKLADFVTLTAIFGVLIGGRLGYVLFYMIPREGLSSFMEHPWNAVMVNEGGMASHGGIIGVCLFVWYYARRHRLSWLATMDGLAIVAPVGIFFGRVANFINGELYGRVTSADNPLAMRFPEELKMYSVSEMQEKVVPVLNTLQHKMGFHVPNGYEGGTAQWLIDQVRENPQVRDAVGSALHPRYPSQLFEACAEGLFIFLILWWIRLRFPKAPNGLFCALFCFLYAFGRILTECYREPDAAMWGVLTRGQYLSFGIILGGFVLLVPVWRQWKAGRRK